MNKGLSNNELTGKFHPDILVQGERNEGKKDRECSRECAQRAEVEPTGLLRCFRAWAILTSDLKKGNNHGKS